MEEYIIDKTLDLRDVICPLNYVKTKLQLEEMEPGQILEVLLDDGEPVLNVPRSVKEDGHKILKVENTGEGFKLLIKRT
jgi:tRNA 2-thiouridine synthesizing protein A